MSGKTEVLTLCDNLKKSYDYDQEAIKQASTTRVPSTAGQVLPEAQQLSQSEMAILTKKSSQFSVKPSSDVSMKAIQLQEGNSSKAALIVTGLGDK